MKRILSAMGHWLPLFLILNGVFTLMLWFISPERLGAAAGCLGLFTVLTCAVGIWLDARRERKRERTLLALFGDAGGMEEALAAWGREWAPTLRELSSRIGALEAQAGEKQAALASYQDFLEGWVHEMKTPLSLATLVLENHREEMSPYVDSRMRHVVQRIGEEVNQILYYARLQADHVDYTFAPVDLRETAVEVLAEFASAARERGVTMELMPGGAVVVTDRKTLHFMLCQLLSNAVRYAPQDTGRVKLTIRQEADRVKLTVEDNGPGAKPEDAPFLFDKGFAGGSPDRQKATGMGLYLVAKFAQALCVDVALNPGSTCGKGFGITLTFSL